LDLLKFEKMAKLDLPEDERKLLAAQAEKLLESFSVLDAVDTDGIEPLVTVLDGQNAMRGDVAEKIISRDELLANAPEQYDGYFQIPRTV